jgi:hypothetical protein
VNASLSLMITALISVALTGCTDVKFSSEEPVSEPVAGLGTPAIDEIQVVPVPSPTPAGAAATIKTLKTLQPALAVRGISCLLCHASVQANLITDFGYGNEFYLGGASGHFDQDQNWYNNLASTWQVAKEIKGTVFIPDVVVTADAESLVTGTTVTTASMKLADLMVTPYKPNWNFDGNNSIQEMAINIHPADPTAPRVTAKSKIVIRAPSSDEIASLAPTLFANSDKVGFQRVGSADPIELLIKDTGNGPFVMNDETKPLNCDDGDIVVKGTLYLRGLKVNASKGCRLYVNGSVFIEDAITYLGTTSDSSLQITSSRAIVMGINVSRLKNRLIGDSRGLQLSGSVPYSTLAADVMQDASTVGSLRDAQDDYGGTRASIDYTALLLNAPIVHSRYLGLVKGTIVAEAALFALGQFHFEFDPIFASSSVLPLLTKPILQTEAP